MHNLIFLHSILQVITNPHCSFVQIQKGYLSGALDLAARGQGGFQPDLPPGLVPSCCVQPAQLYMADPVYEKVKEARFLSLILLPKKRVLTLKLTH